MDKQIFHSEIKHPPSENVSLHAKIIIVRRKNAISEEQNKI